MRLSSHAQCQRYCCHPPSLHLPLGLVYRSVRLLYLIYLALTSTVIGSHFEFSAGVPVVYVIYQANISQCPICKIPHLHLHWAICGNVCQMYTRIWWLCRNQLIFVPRCMPLICKVFGSQYCQVKLEGPLHIPGVYQNIIGLGFAGICPVYVVIIWHTPGI